MMSFSITILLGVVCFSTVLCASLHRDEDDRKLNLEKLSGLLESYKGGELADIGVLSRVIKDFQRSDGVRQNETGNSNIQRTKSSENNLTYSTTEFTTMIEHATEDASNTPVELSSSYSEPLFTEESTEEIPYTRLEDHWEYETETTAIYDTTWTIDEMSGTKLYNTSFLLTKLLTTFESMSEDEYDNNIQTTEMTNTYTEPILTEKSKEEFHWENPVDDSENTSANVNTSNCERWIIEESGDEVRYTRLGCWEDGTESPMEDLETTASNVFISQQNETADYESETYFAITNATDFPLNDGAADLCENPPIDTITRTEDGSTYVFKGNFYWKIISDGIDEKYPRRIADDWGGLEGNLDASFTEPYGYTYFFKGKYYWRFTNQQMDSGYPRLISEGFKGIPDDIDAALAWSSNGKPYFFKGDKYWRYDKYSYPAVHENYPREIHHWRGLPVNNIDAAFVWHDGYSYFFVGGNYYRYDDPVDAVAVNDPPYPHPTGPTWYLCEKKCYNY